jgi:tetratricopeptide (TPR) repeat protein
MRKFNQAWLLDNNNAETYFGFGVILSKREQPEKAIEMYGMAIKLNPKYYEAYANRGLDYYRNEQYDAAIKDFTNAIKIRPEEGQTYNDRAVAYFVKKEYDKCWEDVCRARELGYKVHPEFLSELKKAGYSTEEE